MSHRYSTNQFRIGLRILHDDTPHSILEYKFVKPGKGQAFTRVKLRNLLTGNILSRTYKSGETAEAADVTELQMQFLYQADEQWFFMHAETFEQYALNEHLIGSSKDWLKTEILCTLTLHNDTAIGIELPHFVELEIVETGSAVKGDTVSGGSKPASLETGASIKVPLFVEVGERVCVDTRNGQYVSRIK